MEPWTVAARRGRLCMWRMLYQLSYLDTPFPLYSNCTVIFELVAPFTLPYQGRNLVPIIRLAVWKLQRQNLGAGLFRLWTVSKGNNSVATGMWIQKPAAWDRSVLVWWHSLFRQINRSFTYQIKENCPTLQPSKQRYKCSEWPSGSGRLSEWLCGDNWGEWLHLWGECFRGTGVLKGRERSPYSNSDWGRPAPKLRPWGRVSDPGRVKWF